MAELTFDFLKEGEPSLFVEEEKSPEFESAKPVYSEADEAQAQVELGGDDEPFSVTPVTEETIKETIETSTTEGLSPTEAANRIKDTNARYSYHEDLAQAAGDLAYTPETVRLLNDKSVDARTAAFNATKSIGTSIIQAEILRLQKEGEDDSLLENVGDFAYETFVSDVLDPLARQAGQQFTDDPVKDDAIVQEFIQKANEESPAEALSFLRDQMEDAGEDVLGFQRISRLYRIMEGIDRFGTTVSETALSVTDVATLGVGGAAVRAGRKTITGANDAVSRVQKAVRGSKDTSKTSANVAEKAMEDVDPSLSREAGAAAGDPTHALRVADGQGISPNRVHASETAKVQVNNRLSQEIDDLLRSEQAGRVTSPELILNASRNAAEAVADRIERSLVDFGVVSNGAEVQSGIIRTAVRVGTRDGRSFSNNLSAQSQAAALRKKNTEGDLTFDVVEDSDGFLIEAQTVRRLDTTELVGSDIFDRPGTGNRIKDSIEGTRDFLLKYLGNSYERLPSNINNQMESVRAILGKKVSDTMRQDIGKLSSKDRNRMNDLLLRLRDGDLSYRREALSDKEFGDIWSEMFSVEPTDEIMTAYRTWREMEHTSWKLEATRVLGEYLKKDYNIGVDVAIGQGSRVLPARVVKVDGLADDDVIYDVFRKDSYTKADLPARYEKATIYRVAPLDEEDTLIKYVVNPEKDPRPLSLEDVYGYNTGGTRINPNGNYMVELGDETLAGKTRTIGTAMTESEARAWTQELKNIMKAIREGSDNVDEIVSKNNSFDPSITTLDEFTEWANKSSLNFGDEAAQVGYKARDEVVQFSDANAPALTKYEAEVIRRQRQDTVLPHYGGAPTSQFDPIDYIHQQTASSVYNITRNAIAISDVESFLFRKKHLIENWDDIKDLNPLAMAARAKFPLSTKESVLAREQLDILSARLHIDSPGEKFLKRLGKKSAEFILDMKGGFPKPVRESGIFENVARRFTDPTNELLHLGFVTKFGFFNFSQLVLQAMHTPVLLAISPRAGLKSSKIATHMWASIMTNDKVAGDLALSRLAKFSGIDEKTLKEIKLDLTRSGRAIINADAAELGTPMSRGFDSFGAENYSRSVTRDMARKFSHRMSRLKDTSLVFFNEGERIARVHSRIIANFEYRAKFPKADPTSQEAINWIAKRDAALSFQMTASGRAMAQRGLLKIPTQWLTYILRAHEAVFVGRAFTPGERLRAAAMLGPFWGAVGTPFVGQDDVDALADWLDIEPGGEIHTTMKTGVLEGALSALIGSENVPNIGFRSAPVQGVVDFWENTVGGQAPEVIGGPSGQILWDISKPLAESLSHLANGRTVLGTEKALQSIRNIAGLDNAFKAAGIIKYGRYVSKTGAVVPGAFSTTEAVFTVLGLTPSQVTRYYEAMQESYDYGKNKRALQRYAQRTVDQAVATNDPDTLARVVGELKDMLLMSALTEEDKYSITRGMLTDVGSRAIKKWLEVPKTVSDDNVDFRTQVALRDINQ